MNGGIIDSNRFAPYGEALDPVAKNARLTNSPFGYTGESHDIEGGLVYLRARYYEPDTMRFLQQDTELGDIQNPLTRNLYAYAGGNPVKYVDPTGHWAWNQYDDLGKGMYARLGDEIKNLPNLLGPVMAYNSIKQWKALLDEKITIAEMYAAGFNSIISDYKYVLDSKNNFKTAYTPFKSGATDKQVYQAGYHAVGIIIDLATLGVAVDDIVRIVRANRALIVTSGGSKVVLWSGGKNAYEAAKHFAKNNGMKVLEQTTRGKMLQTINNALIKVVGKEKAYKLMSKFWDKSSASFAKGANGEVHAFLNAQGISDTSVFMRIEKKIIEDKGLKMIFHLVKGD